MSARTPLYPRLLRLRHIHPNGWQRAALGEGAVAVAGVLVLADLATAWTLLALPVAVAVVVKSHDLVAGALARSGRAPSPPAGDASGSAQERGPREEPATSGEVAGPAEEPVREVPGQARGGVVVMAPRGGGPPAPRAAGDGDAPEPQEQDADSAPAGERSAPGRLGALRRLARTRR